MLQEMFFMGALSCEQHFDQCYKAHLRLEINSMFFTASLIQKVISKTSSKSTISISPKYRYFTTNQSGKVVNYMLFITF